MDEISGLDAALPPGRRREQVIAECLATLGKVWASRHCQEMRRDSRCIEGGWPGRLAEARAQAMHALTRELSARGLVPPSAAELAAAATTVNAHARQEWDRAGRAERRAVKPALGNDRKGFHG